jgi:dTDP-4-amino-4,6-dideoxygalactose transaminase
VNKQIYLSPPHMTGEELVYMTEAIQSNWVAPVGPHIDSFEKELAECVGVEDTVVVNSGTSAIHLALLAVGVSHGDEVICPSLTFCATANPVVYCGARPIFVDSEMETWNLDPGLLREAVSDRIKKTGKKPAAILVVHLYGMPAKMNEILSVGRDFEIPIIEDSAEALGSLYHGKMMGTLGKAGVYSFNGNKIITTSGGGALISGDASILARGRFLRQEAKEPLPYYEHRETGFNYRLSNICAGIGRAQLKELTGRVEQRRAIFQTYQRYLASTGRVEFQEEPAGHFSNRWLTVIRFREGWQMKEKVYSGLANVKIESRFAWKPMHLQPVFRGIPMYGGEKSEALFNDGLCLPSGSALSASDLDRILSSLMALM